MATNLQTTTIRIPVAAKERLERLRHRWHRLRGTRPTQQALIERALEYAEEHAEAFITDKGWKPWSPAEADAFLAEFGFDGPANLASSVDDAVYPADPNKGIQP